MKNLKNHRRTPQPNTGPCTSEKADKFQLSIKQTSGVFFRHPLPNSLAVSAAQEKGELEQTCKSTPRDVRSQTRFTGEETVPFCSSADENS